MNWKQRKEEILTMTEGFPSDVRKAIVKMYKSTWTARNLYNAGYSWDYICNSKPNDTFYYTAEWIGHPAYAFDLTDEQKERYEWYKKFCEIEGSVPDADFGDHLA